VKIVHVCGWYFPDSLGGTETYVSAVAERLRGAGHHVLVAAPDPGAHGERSYAHDGLTVYRYPIPAAPTRAEAQHASIARGAEQFHAWLRHHRPDVVHFHTFVTGVGPNEIRAARETGARVVVTTHSGSLGFLCQRGTLLQWGRQPCDGRVTAAKCAACELQHRGVPRPLADTLAWIPPAVSRVAGIAPGKVGTAVGMPALIARNQALQRQMIADVDAFVVLTEGARRIVAAGCDDDTSIVLNRLGIRATDEDVSRLRDRPRVQRSHVTMAYVGRFDRIKGVHDLARAMRALPTGLKLELDFRGPVSNVRELTIVNELKAIVGPDAWVTFGEPLRPADVFDYLRDVDVLCCPSRTLEGGPTVALEAMAVGTPVIATAIGAMAEVIEDGVNGRLVRPGDWRGLSNAIKAVAVNPADTIDVWQRNLPSVRTMDDVTRDYLALYGAVN
jgi:glycosyltransferase involved in cell wall biosynthesis